MKVGIKIAPPYFYWFYIAVHAGHFVQRKTRFIEIAIAIKEP
jgi:hypothetical protein